MSKCAIRPIPLARGPYLKSRHTYFTGEGETVEVAYYIWYIEGPRENIIVDAGVTAEILSAAGRLGRTDIQSVEDGLGKVSLKPSNIDVVIVTHLHHDHFGLARKFTNAEFIVQKKELDEARNPHPIWALTYSYKRQKVFEGLNFKVIEGDREIVEGVQVILTPGHTPGAQSVLVETTEGLALITGFCCIRENFDNPPQELKEARAWTVIPPALHYNALEAYDSMLRIKQIAPQIIIPLHSAEFINVERIP